MNYLEAEELIEKKILPEIHRRFEDKFPDIWIKSRTDCKEVYEQANGCMYKWYIKTISAISKKDFSPKYQQSYNEVVSSDWSVVQRFYDDLLTTEDFLKFIVENVMIGY
jgi:hypothetical protein